MLSRQNVVLTRSKTTVAKVYASLIWAKNSCPLYTARVFPFCLLPTFFTHRHAWVDILSRYKNTSFFDFPQICSTHICLANRFLSTFFVCHFAITSNTCLLKITSLKASTTLPLIPQPLLLSHLWPSLSCFPCIYLSLPQGDDKVCQYTSKIWLLYVLSFSFSSPSQPESFCIAL